MAGGTGTATETTTKGNEMKIEELNKKLREQVVLHYTGARIIEVTKVLGYTATGISGIIRISGNPLVRPQANLTALEAALADSPPEAEIEHDGESWETKIAKWKERKQQAAGPQYRTKYDARA